MRARDFAIAAAWVLIVVGSVFLLPLAWSYFSNLDLSDSGYLYHDKMALVYSRGWQAGEYKRCTNVNAEAGAERPYLQCVDPSLGEEGKVFKVRFYGRTYVDQKPFETLFYWTCRKNEGGDPSITCKLAPEQKQPRPQ